ncbi:component of the polarisome [Rhizoclosmatium sp. JEL0117]|nr:component of the polarisome [Rhizoclosmatium sp. JEL0117]
MTSTGDQYITLRTFLGADFLDSPEGSEANSEASKERMGRLNQQQFTVFTVDVIDEILRRKEGPNAPSSLLPRQDFHPKRNATRAKLSSLAIFNFRKMAADAFFELERRYPNLVNEYPRQQKSTRPPSFPQQNTPRANPAPLQQPPLPTPQTQQHPTTTTQSTPKPPAMTTRQPTNPSKSIEEILAGLGDLVSPTTRTPLTGASAAAADATSTVLRDAMERMRKDNAAKQESLNATITSLQDKLAETQRDMDLTLRDAQDRLTELETVKEEVFRLQEDLAESNAESQGLRKELTAAQKMASDAVAEAATLRTEMSLLRQGNQDTVSEVSAARRELSEAKKMYLDAQGEATGLRGEVDRLKAELASVKTLHARQVADYAALKADYGDIKGHISDQAVLFGEVRTETTSLLAEVKSMSARNAELRAQNEQLALKNEDGIKMADELAQSYDDIVRNFEALKSENEGLREQVQQLMANGRGGGGGARGFGGPGGVAGSEVVLPKMAPLSHDGVLDMSAAQAYQSAVENLLRAVRVDSSAVLPALKSIISACKQATESIEDFETTHYKNQPFAKEQDLDDARAQFSKSMTALIAATKTHVSRGNAAEKVDAAVATMTETLSRTAQLVKAKCADEGADEILYEKIQQLKDLVETNTVPIVEGIQALLSTMRGPSGSPAFLKDMNSKVSAISVIVKSILKASQVVFSQMSDEDEFKVECEAVLNSMANTRKRLEGKMGELSKDVENADIKQAIGASAYEVAKLVKKFVALLDEV